MLCPRPFTMLMLLLIAPLLTGCAEPEAEPGSGPDQHSENEPALVAPVAGSPRSGAALVNQYCLTCHGRGLYNAPKLDDTVAWQPRLAAGNDVLWQSLLHGKKAMPARGTCNDCSDDELRAALNHLLAQVSVHPAQ